MYDDEHIDYFTCHRSKLWSYPLWILNKQQITTSNGKKKASSINPARDAHLFPAFIEWDLPKQLSICYSEAGYITLDNYALGYILGAFMVCGVFNQSQETIRYNICNNTNSNQRTLTKLVTYLAKVFPKAKTPLYDEKYGCLFIDNRLHHVYETFEYNVMARTFPKLFMSTKPDYQAGIYDGILDMSRESGVVSQHIYETALVASIIKANRPGYTFSIPFSQTLSLSDSSYYGNYSTTFELEESSTVLVDTLIYNV